MNGAVALTGGRNAATAESEGVRPDGNEGQQSSGTSKEGTADYVTQPCSPKT